MQQNFHRPKFFKNGDRTITRNYVEKFENQNRNQINKERGGFKPQKYGSHNDGAKNVFDYSNRHFENQREFDEKKAPSQI